MHQQPRYLAGGIENEGIRPRNVRFEQAERRRIDLGEQPHLRQVAAQQREVVLLVQLAQAPNPLDGVFIANLAAQRVGRVGRVNHHATLADDLDGLFYQARLWVLRMNLEKLAHVVILFIAPKAVHAESTPQRWQILGQRPVGTDLSPGAGAMEVTASACQQAELTSKDGHRAHLLGRHHPVDHLKCLPACLNIVGNQLLRLLRVRS